MVTEGEFRDPVNTEPEITYMAWVNRSPYPSGFSVILYRKLREDGLPHWFNYHTGHYLDHEWIYQLKEMDPDAIEPEVQKMLI